MPDVRCSELVYSEVNTNSDYGMYVIPLDL